MTVRELRKTLEGMHDATPVVVVSDCGDGRDMCEIASATIHRGEPGRPGEGPGWFRYDANGPVEWLLLQTTQAPAMKPRP